MNHALRLLPLILASALSLPVLAQNSAASSLTPPDQQALLERLLRVNNPNGSNTITFGGLPDSLPITFGSAVQIQATVRSVGVGSIPSYRIFAVSSGTLDAARQALVSDLRASGWQPIPRLPINGFQPTEGSLNDGFLHEGKFPLTLDAAVQTVQERVELDIKIDTVTASTISGLKKSARSYPKSSLPVLTPPVGATVNVSPDLYRSKQGQITSARVQSKLSANEVLAFYSQQLKKAGWRAVTDTRSGQLRVVIYLLTDLGGRQAVGVLGVRTQAEGDYILTASVNGFNPIQSEP